MSSTETPTLLTPVNVSTEPVPADRLVELLAGVNIVLLGYFPVPDQSLPAQLKLTRGDKAQTRLDQLADRLGANSDIRRIETELVFTHDRQDPIDRIADERGCDAVLIPGEAETVERILVPLRSDVNMEQILTFVGAVAGYSGGSITLFHAATDGTESGERLLGRAADRLVTGGIDRTKITQEVAEDADGDSQIIEHGSAFDLIVLGETEPSLRKQIFGTTPEKIAEHTSRPVVVVRNGVSEDTA